MSAKQNSCVADCFVLIIKEILGLKRHIRTSRLGEEDDFFISEVNEKNCEYCRCCEIM